VITDADVREVDPACVDVCKRGGCAAAITEEDMREVYPSCIDTHNGGENDCKSVNDDMDAREFDPRAYEGERYRLWALHQPRRWNC
jgi:hypothetical protein